MRARGLRPARRSGGARSPAASRGPLAWIPAEGAGRLADRGRDRQSLELDRRVHPALAADMAQVGGEAVRAIHERGTLGCSPSQRPSWTRATGRRCARTISSRASGATAPRGPMPGSPSSAARPAAERPRLPVTATASPGRAIERVAACPCARRGGSRRSSSLLGRPRCPLRR